MPIENPELRRNVYLDKVRLDLLANESEALKALAEQTQKVGDAETDEEAKQEAYHLMSLLAVVAGTLRGIVRQAKKFDAAVAEENATSQTEPLNSLDV